MSVRVREKLEGAVEPGFAPLDLESIAQRALDNAAANSKRGFEAKKANAPLTCESAHYWPCHWQVAIELATPDDTLGQEGLIAKADISMQAEEYMINVGRVFACGPTALDGKTESGVDLSKFLPDITTPEQLIGKWVIFQKHTGLRLTLRATEQVIVICTVTELMGVTDAPKAFKYYL